MEIIKVVLTGGPCAGKTTALNSIKEYLRGKDIPFITVPETATELILSSMKCEEKLIYMFQSLVLRKQLSKESIAKDYAESFYDFCDKCIIIYDRGILDNKAYLTNKSDFSKLLAKYNLTEIDTIDEYDLVLDLLSLATCKREAYNLLNKARTESPEVATYLDSETSLAWVNHRNLRVIDSSVSLEEESEIILNYIKELLNGKQEKKVRKFLVDDRLSNYDIYDSSNSGKLYVTDYILEGDDDKYNYVLSKREYNYDTSYVYSIYNECDGKVTMIENRKITNDEYYKLLNKYNILDKIERKEINFISNRHKHRLCFYEDYTVLEVEENNLDNELIFPDNLEIIKEITKENGMLKVRKLR